jgi:FkbM family methyltransferase
MSISVSEKFVKTTALSSTAPLGKMLRYPLRFLPRSLAVPVVSGSLRGKRWIVGSGIHRCWLGFYEQEKQELIARTIKPGTVFYDVGANVGFYTLLGSLLVGEGKVFAFEPVQRNLMYLRKHLGLNQIQNVQVFELAISGSDGTAGFELEQSGYEGRLSGNGTVIVRTASLDSLLRQDKILPPNYIKMDIEGGELLALRGASQCIQRHRPHIFLATHGHEVHSQCCQLLESWGYHSQILELNPSGFGEIIATPRN